MATKKALKNILILNGSPQGNHGNSQILIEKLVKNLKGDTNSKVWHLAKKKYSGTLKAEIEWADGMIFVSGTYWDSWGSPLQEFLEKGTELEGSRVLLGKPCAVFILMHSVGGKGVLSRLQGVLSTLGFLIPPMSGMVYSSVGHAVLKSGAKTQDRDIWSLNDISVILGNLRLALQIQKDWISWPSDQKNFKRVWLK